MSVKCQQCHTLNGEYQYIPRYSNLNLFVCQPCYQYYYKKDRRNLRFWFLASIFSLGILAPIFLVKVVNNFKDPIIRDNKIKQIINEENNNKKEEALSNKN